MTRLHSCSYEADASVEGASAYLLAQADRQFAEVRHRMRFSRAAGFTGSSEDQTGDIFARATLANLFLDIAQLLQSPQTAASLRAGAVREAEYVAGARVTDRAGGWSYFPDLPELPPDVDSLAAALSLFARIAPGSAPLCRVPVDLVLAGADPDGSFETWIVAASDAPANRARMEWAIQNCWGTGADPDVLAHFYYALWLWDPQRYAAAIARGAAKVLDMQQPDGSWCAAWYAGPAYGTAMAVRLLRAAGMGDAARQRSQRFLLGSQRADGGWGDESLLPLQTALSVAALHDAAPGRSSTAVDRAATALCERQLADGSWDASPWIQMEIGRATGKILHVATYQSVILTTAFCLRALLLSVSGG
jgi:squalene-hopene/tetraprenyl-beta-curcumene cyclase